MDNVFSVYVAHGLDYLLHIQCSNFFRVKTYFFELRVKLPTRSILQKYINFFVVEKEAVHL
jgi:hypothetical protein